MTADPRFWDGIAEQYSKKPVDDPEAFERKIAVTHALMRPEHVVLDIGCGTGSLALRLAPHAREVHGLDVSPEMMRIANGKASAAGIGNVTFHTGPFDDSVSFAPASLDGICAYSLLHLVDDAREALDRIHGLLKPGGFFVSSTVCLGDSWVPYGPMLAVMRWVGKAPMVRRLRQEALLDEMRAAGFEGLERPDVGAAPSILFAVARKPV
ncbi:MAG: class I SAM-dependent methyltransferase [Myxococcota bacterium]